MNFQGIFHLYMQRASGDAILETARTLWSLNRGSNFDGWLDAARHAARAFEEAGLNATVHEWPADGAARFGDAVMPKAWNARKASLDMIAPQQKTLATLEDQPLMLAPWSPSTAPNGMEAELVCLGEGDSIHSPSIDVEGKFILTRGRAQDLRQDAIHKGAAAILSCWSNTPAQPDWTQAIQTNSSNPGGWGTKKDEDQIIMISLSPKQGDALFHTAAKGPVKLKLTVDAHLQAGVLPAVDAWIDSEFDDQEAWVYAPLNGPGANYNAVSAAALIEAARIINAEIKAGALPSPARRLRFLLLPKPYGSLAYAAKNEEFTRKALYAFCLESAAGDPDAAWSRWSLRTTPAPLRHFSDALMKRIMSDFAANWRPQRRVESETFSTVADIWFNDPALGVPSHWLHGGAHDEVRHSSGDTPETLDRRSCIDLAAAAATAGYIASVLGIPDIPILSQWNYRLAQENIWSEIDFWMDKADEAQSSSDLKDIWRDARLRLEARKQAEAAALQSLSEIDPQAHESAEWEVVRELNYTLGDLCSAAEAALRAHLSARAAALETEFMPEESLSHSHEDERVPKRIGNAIGAVTLESLPYDKWTSPVRHSPRSNAVYTLAWWLADGTRSIGEIERLVRLETPRFRECIPAWFTFLEKHGYVSFVHGSDD